MFGRSLSMGQVLPPILGAWAGNIVFLFIGCFFLFKIHRLINLNFREIVAES